MTEGSSAPLGRGADASASVTGTSEASTRCIGPTVFGAEASAGGPSPPTWAPLTAAAGEAQRIRTASSGHERRTSTSHPMLPGDGGRVPAESGAAPALALLAGKAPAEGSVTYVDKVFG